MKGLVFTSVLLSLCASGQVLANCQNSPLVADAGTLLSGKTVCAARGSESWQEEHRSGGDLYDYKRGPNDPIDPTEKEGTWATNASSVSYRYSGDPGTAFIYTIRDAGAGIYSFCGSGGDEIAVTLKGIGAGC